MDGDTSGALRGLPTPDQMEVDGHPLEETQVWSGSEAPDCRPRVWWETVDLRLFDGLVLVGVGVITLGLAFLDRLRSVERRIDGIPLIGSGRIIKAALVWFPVFMVGIVAIGFVFGKQPAPARAFMFLVWAACSALAAFAVSLLRGWCDPDKKVSK